MRVLPECCVPGAGGACSGSRARVRSAPLVPSGQGELGWEWTSSLHEKVRLSPATCCAGIWLPGVLGSGCQVCGEPGRG